MAAIAGLRGSGDMGTDERPKNFRELILWRSPTGDAPIFALMAKVKKKTTNDPEFSWWDEPQDLVRLQVNGAISSTSATTIVVDSADPSAVVDNNWGVATHLKAGDLLLVEPSTDAATFNHEILEVVSVSSDTVFSVRRGAGGTTAASIADDSYLLLIGSAYSEGSAAPRSVSRKPIKYYNYTQIFKNTYEITGTLNETNLRTGEAWSNDKKRKVFDHSRDIEMAMLFGRKYETTGDNGKPLRYMGGIRESIPSTRTKIYSSAVTVNGFIDDVYKVFDHSTPAGDERICFCGNLALNNLNKVIQADANTDIQYGGVFKVYGMNFREFILPQGRLLLRTHPLLNRHSMYSKSMFILDFASLNYVAMKNRDTKTRDDVQAKDEDVRRGYLQTECSVQVDRGGLTCGYLGNIIAS